VCVGFGLGLGLGRRVGDGEGDGVRVGRPVARGVGETEVTPPSWLVDSCDVQALLTTASEMISKINQYRFNDSPRNPKILSKSENHIKPLNYKRQLNGANRKIIVKKVTQLSRGRGGLYQRGFLSELVLTLFNRKFDCCTNLFFNFHIYKLGDKDDVDAILSQVAS